MNQVKEKKKSRREMENEQIRIEKNFHKTAFGKIVRRAFIVTCIAMIAGLIILLICNIINIEGNIRIIGEKCIHYSEEAAFVIMIIYCVFLPEWTKNKKKSSKQ